MNIKSFQKQWNALGANDPMWAVLTDPAKQGNRWDRDEFFATGVTQVEGIWQNMKKLNIQIQPGTAIDFGCGLGRLTQALCPRFEKCIGIDLSESMVQKAQEYNQFSEKCTYLVNAEPDLRQIPDNSADFILSLIALQHTASAYQKRYIEDFIRILKPGGVAHFQIIQTTFLRSLIPDSLTERYRRWKHGDKPFISMYGLNASRVRKIANVHGASIIDSQVELDHDYNRQWSNHWWYLRK